MARRRGLRAHARDLCRGPGHLTRALALTTRQNGADLTRGPLTIDPRDAPREARITAGPRIGITRARHLRLRFWIAGNPWGSRPARAHTG